MQKKIIIHFQRPIEDNETTKLEYQLPKDFDTMTAKDQELSIQEIIDSYTDYPSNAQLEEIKNLEWNTPSNPQTKNNISVSHWDYNWEYEREYKGESK